MAPPGEPSNPPPLEWTGVVRQVRTFRGDTETTFQWLRCPPPLGTKLRRKVLGAVRATLKPLFNGSGCPPPRGTIQLPVGVLRWPRHRRGDPLPPPGFRISVCQKPWPGTQRWQLYYPASYCSFEGEVSTHTSELDCPWSTMDTHSAPTVVIRLRNMLLRGCSSDQPNRGSAP